MDVTLPRLLTMADAARALEVQSRAFVDDPLWVYLYPDRQKRIRAQVPFFGALVRFGILNEQAYGIGTPIEAFAVWSMPGQKTKMSAVLRSGFASLLFSPLVPQLLRAGKIFSRFETMHKKYSPAPDYYLNTISVLPEAQGKGLASKLIKPFLAKADAEGIGAYTETMTPSNVGLYEHYGFRCMEDYAVPGTDLHLWSFYRAVA